MRFSTNLQARAATFTPPRWLPWALLVAALVLGATRLRFETDLLSLLPRDLDMVRGLQLYERHFTDARELIVTLDSPSSQETEAAASELALRFRAHPKEVARVVWRPGYADDPAQAAELLAFLWLNQPPGEVAALAARLTSERLRETAEEARAQLATTLSPVDLATRAHDPFGLIRLVDRGSAGSGSPGTGDEFFASADGTFRVIFLQSRGPLDDYRACREWLAAVRGIVDEARHAGKLKGDVTVGFTGRPAFVDEMSRSMENDLAGSCTGTLATIGLLFWLAHRRVRPLVWLLTILLLITAGTLALGGLFLGTLNVVSLGFAAILLGLAEDFGILLYQESRTHPDLDAAGLRRMAGPGILWSAITTAGAFLTLTLSRLPGLAQLGSLVALGIALAAVVMLFGFTPVLLRLRRPRDASGSHTSPERFLLFKPWAALSPLTARRLTLGLGIAAAAIVLLRGVKVDRSPEAFEPRQSEARAALSRVQSLLSQQRDPMWVIIPGGSVSEVGTRLERVDAVLAGARASGAIKGYELPLALWPKPEWQRSNVPVLRELSSRQEAFDSAARDAGFNEESMTLTRAIMDTWRGLTPADAALWPSGDANRWLLGKVSASIPDGWLALGSIQTPDLPIREGSPPAGWAREIREAGALVSGWHLLGDAVFDAARLDLRWIAGIVSTLVLLTLWLAFKSWRDVALSLATLVYAAGLLGAVMGCMGWSWNLMNLVAIPLLLGMGVDFSIHMQLALRNHGGDTLAVRDSTGRALLLAGSTTVAGFASLAFSTNSGMASLGRTCALGIGLTLLVAVYLLPAWWRQPSAQASKDPVA